MIASQLRHFTLIRALARGYSIWRTASSKGNKKVNLVKKTTQLGYI